MGWELRGRRQHIAEVLTGLVVSGVLVFFLGTRGIDIIAGVVSVCAGLGTYIGLFYALAEYEADEDEAAASSSTN
jgi:hypothetical protein